jgi:hypothetical protein
LCAQIKSRLCPSQGEKATQAEIANRRLGSWLGLMSRSNADQGAERAPSEGDRRTEERHGRRFAEIVRDWKRGGAYRTEHLVETDTNRYLKCKQVMEVARKFPIFNVSPYCTDWRTGSFMSGHLASKRAAYLSRRLGSDHRTLKTLSGALN